MSELLVNSGCVCGEYQVDLLGTKHERPVGYCVTCGVLRSPLHPVDYEAYYTDGDTYHTERAGQIPYRERYEHDIAVGVSRLDVLRSVIVPRLLDIGCANGGFVRAARSQGWVVEGLELNANIARWAGDQTGARVHTSWDTVQGLFDVITAHDVVEHVVQPVTWLRDVRKHLTPNGYLVLDTPDAGHEDFVRDPMASRHLKPLEHLWFFREEDLRQVCTDAGFVVQQVDRPIPGKLVFYVRPQPCA